MNCDCVKKIEEELPKNKTFKGKVIESAEVQAGLILTGPSAGRVTTSDVFVKVQGMLREQKLSMLHSHCPFCGTLIAKETVPEPVKTAEIFRPHWVEPEYLKELGYELVSDKDGYLKYKNAPGTVGRFYGPMNRGKRLIYFNTTWQPDKDLVFVGIREDADTRNAFNGACSTEEEFKTILNCIQ